MARAAAIAQNTRAEEELRRLKERTIENRGSAARGHGLQRHGRDDRAAASHVPGAGRHCGRRPVARRRLVVVATGARSPGARRCRRSGCDRCDRCAGCDRCDGCAGCDRCGRCDGCDGCARVRQVRVRQARRVRQRRPAPEPSLIDRAAATVKSAVDKVMGTPADAPCAGSGGAATSAASDRRKSLASPRQSRSCRKCRAGRDGDACAAPATAPAPPAPVVLAAPPVDDAVYTSADPAVIPPVLVRPVLPKEPPQGRSRGGYRHHRRARGRTG